jgi:hypothetical protein
VRKLLSIAAAAPLLVLVAGAQGPDEARAREKMMRAEEDMAKAMQMKVQAIGAVRGAAVKNAPYSGEEVNETNQMLADGTRIHRETRAMVYRDGEGRTRRETPESIIINDPVANVTYILNPKTMTGQKLATMSQYSMIRKPLPGGGTASTSMSTFTMRMESDGGTPTITVNGETLDPKKVQEMIAQAKADGVAADHMVFTTDNTVTSHVIGGAMAGPMADRVMLKKGPAGEALGKQNIEGVDAEGTRTVNTIKAGSIGNDRDIQVTGESWYSPELQTMVMSKHSDPRTGEENFRLTNINRNEPAAYLFQVPSGYTINGK